MIYLRRLFRAILGNTLMGAGIALIISGQLGVDPWTVLTLGTSRTFHLTPGHAAQIQGLVLLLGALVLYRRRPGIGTILNLLLVGYFIDFFSKFCPTPQSLLSQLLMLFSGITIIGVGVGVYVSAKLGEGPIEQLMVSLHERHGWPVGRIRIVMDAVAASTGLVLGGTVGIGTVLGVVAIGPVVEQTLRMLSRVPQQECEFRN